MVMFMLTYVCFICLFVFYALRVIYPWLLETIFICIWWASICLTMTITLKLRRFALWWYSLDSNTWFTNKLELTPAKIQYNILLATTYYLFNTILLGFRQNDFSKFIYYCNFVNVTFRHSWFSFFWKPCIHSNNQFYS